MQTYVLPQLADIPVDQVGTAAVDDVLRPLAMAGKHPTARAVGTHIAAVLRWAALREHRPNDNPVSVVLAELPKRTTAVKHHAALHYSEVGAALRRIDSGAFARQARRAADRADRRPSGRDPARHPGPVRPRGRRLDGPGGEHEDVARAPGSVVPAGAGRGARGA